MKKITLLMLLMYVSFTSATFAQTLYRTYYDYDKTHVHEEYYANSYGVKNGLYKAFSEYGGILIEGTQKDDKKEGKWTSWNEKGKKVLEETFKKDMLNGPSTEYDENGVKQEEGNYTDNIPTGNWYRYYFYQDDGRPEHTDVPKSVIVGNEYVKCREFFDLREVDDYYNNGMPKRDYAKNPTGHIINTFYPSGKKYMEGDMKNGNWVGDCYTYYPNGKVEKFDENDTITGKTLFEKTWKYPGGTKDSVPYYKEQIRTSMNKAESERRRQDSLAKIEQYRQDSLNEISHKEAELKQHRQDSVNEILRKEAELKQHRQDSVTAIAYIKQQELSRQPWKIDSLYKVFTGVYTGSKKSMFFLDPKTHQPLVNETYPKGKHLYQKADILYNSWNNEYKTLADLDAKVNKGRKIIVLLTRLDGMASTDTDDLDKQMKKADTNEDIEKVLGL